MPWYKQKAEGCAELLALQGNRLGQHVGFDAKRSLSKQDDSEKNWRNGPSNYLVAMESAPHVAFHVACCSSDLCCFRIQRELFVASYVFLGQAT